MTRLESLEGAVTAVTSESCQSTAVTRGPRGTKLSYIAVAFTAVTILPFWVRDVMISVLLSTALMWDQLD